MSIGLASVGVDLRGSVQNCSHHVNSKFAHHTLSCLGRDFLMMAKLVAPRAEDAMRPFFLAVSLAVMATTAAAQTSTTCYVLGRWVNCSTSPTPPQNQGPVDYVTPLVNAQRAVPSIDVLGAFNAGLAAGQRQRVEAAQREVSQLVASGRCSEAKQLALREGDMDLAEQARRLCVER